MCHRVLPCVVIYVPPMRPRLLSLGAPTVGFFIYVVPVIRPTAVWPTGSQLPNCNAPMHWTSTLLHPPVSIYRLAAALFPQPLLVLLFPSKTQTNLSATFKHYPLPVRNGSLPPTATDTPVEVPMQRKYPSLHEMELRAIPFPRF